MEHGDILKFKLVDVKRELPSIQDDYGTVIGFVPFEGFQSVKYYNGSNSWKSSVTGHSTDPTYWLKKIQS